MSVHRICEIDPFWTKKKFLQKDTQTDRRKPHRRRRSNSSLDMETLKLLFTHKGIIIITVIIFKKKLFLLYESDSTAIILKNMAKNVTFQTDSSYLTIFSVKSRYLVLKPVN